jgi:hypothetical protein
MIRIALAKWFYQTQDASRRFDKVFYPEFSVLPEK